MGRTLNLTFLNDFDNGPRLVSMGGWNGKAVYSMFDHADEVIRRDEFTRPGVYILKGQPEDPGNSEKIYIGQADELRQRLKTQMTDRGDSFTEFLAFYTSDDAFHSTTTKYIESRLIEQAKESRFAECENKVFPRKRGLNEGLIQEMESFLKNIRFILPTVGYHFLSTAKPVSPAKVYRCVFTIRSKTIVATMVVSDGRFMVLKGSQAGKLESPTISEGWKSIRRQLLKAGILIDAGETYVFAEDFLFESSSAASSVVLARQSTGPQSWYDEKGTSLKELQESGIVL